MRVVPLDQALEPAWTAFLEQCRDVEAGIYHTLEWRDLTCEVFGHEARYLVALANERVVGILPLFLVRGFFGRQLVSLPLRDRGGPLAVSDESRDALLQEAVRLFHALKCDTLELKTLEPIPGLAATDHGFQLERYWKNTLVSLPDDPAALWKRLHKKSVRWAIGKSQRDGVTARWGESHADYAAFYEMFLQTRRRLAVPPYGLDLFESIRTRLQSNGMAKPILGEHEGTAVSGMILFYFKDRVIEAYAASDDKALHLRPNNLILWEALRDACVRGYRVYDFGGTSPTNTGLLQFKLRWGGEETTLTTTTMTKSGKQVFHRDGTGLFLKTFRTAFRLMPIACSRRIGPYFTKKTG